MVTKVFWGRHRTVIGAIAATVLLGGLVLAGRMQPPRVLVPLTIAWMLALHSADNRRMSERYERAIGEGLVGLAKAGVEFRLGKKGAAAQEIATAVQVVTNDLQQSAEATDLKVVV